MPKGDEHTNEYAALFMDLAPELGQHIGEKEARSFLGMLHKRVGAVKTYRATKQALQKPRQNYRAYIMGILLDRRTRR